MVCDKLLLGALAWGVVFPFAAVAANSINTASLQSCASQMNGKLPKTVPTDFHFSGNVRRYYIAAEQVSWNYVPTGWDNWMGVPINVSTRAALAGYGPPALGYVWEKALYRGYTDATFKQYSPTPNTVGTQGPTMRAEVGDMLEILFVNKLPENYASMHSMGLAYSKYNEGSDYYDPPIPPAPDNAVAPGDCVVLKWLIDDGSSPTKGATSRLFGYHGYVTLEQDIDAGLAGPTIVYSRGKMASTMAANREFTLFYMQYNEAASFMSATNAKKFGKPANKKLPVVPTGYGNETFWRPQVTNLATSMQLSLTEAPIFDSLNGYLYANNPAFEVCVNDPTIWYVTSFGSHSHTFHMHGNGFVYQGLNMPAIGINPGTLLTLYSSMNGQGVWQLICHVSGHQTGGMVTNYIVHPASSCPLTPLSKA